MKKILSFFIIFSFLSASFPAYCQTGQRTQQLLDLQHQAHSLLQTNPLAQEYIRDILAYTGAVLLIAHLKKFSQQQLKAAIATQLQNIPSSAHAPISLLPQNTPYYMAAKKTAADPAQLSLFPDEAPAPKSAPAPAKEDLSWLDAPQEPLKSTRPKPSPELFDDPQFQSKKPQKSYLSKRVEAEYGQTNLFKKLTPQEIEGLFQRLDQAAAIHAKSGKETAQRFLHDMANKYPRAQILFISAKRMLLGGVLLLVADRFIRWGQEDASFQRFLANPQLFLQADAQEISILAQNPQSLQYAQLLVEGLKEITHADIGQEEVHFMRQATRQMHQEKQALQLKNLPTY